MTSAQIAILHGLPLLVRRRRGWDAPHNANQIRFTDELEFLSDRLNHVPRPVIADALARYRHGHPGTLLPRGAT